MPKPTSPSEAPSAISDTDRVKLIANHLASYDQQLFQLDLDQIANNHDDLDRLPGAQPGEKGGVVTYASRRALLQDGKRRIANKYPKLMPQVEAFLAGVRSSQAGENVGE